jgi:signal transduction histidine kinase
MTARIPLFRSLRVKLVSLAIVVEALMLFLLVWNCMRLMEGYLTRQMEHRVEELQPLLNAGLAGPLLQEDLATLRDITQQFVAGEVRYLTLYGGTNQKLLSVGEGAQSGTPVAGDPWARHNEIVDGGYYLRMPILLGGQRVGRLEMALSTDYIAQALWTLRQQSLGIAFTEVLLSVMVLGMLGYMLTRHLRDLTQAARRIAEGDFSSHVEVSARDEVGEAATAFNLMSNHIEASQSSLRASESRVRQLNEELEQRVKRRTEELSEANLRLEQSIEQLQLAQRQLVENEKMAALGGLVAGVAHEINTPLGIGVTAASHLRMTVEKFAQTWRADGAVGENGNKILHNMEESARIILSNLERASGLIRSFKQVAVDQSSDQIRRFGLKDYLQEVLQSLHPKFKGTAHTVALECPADLTITSHPGALSQILTNLVLNSLIHGFDGVARGEVRIVAARDGDHIDMHYQDNGKGMSASSVTHVFEPFFTTRRGQGGSGLGMHIVYNLVTQTLRGQIDCHSAPGAGVDFRIRFPVNRESFVAVRAAVVP